MKKSILKIYTDDEGNYYVESYDGTLIPLKLEKSISYYDLIKNNECVECIELMRVRTYYIGGIKND